MKKYRTHSKIQITLSFSLALLAGFSSPSWANSRVIQILHTNDLHSALDGSGAPKKGEKNQGHWARIKAKMDALTNEAAQKGITTFRFDSGDFFEGTLHYFPNYGGPVLNAFGAMGYDAAALGNHDWLMGAVDTEKAFLKNPLPFPVLSANIEISDRLKGLKTMLKPSHSIERNGIKVAVIGLSTPESIYSWYADVNSNPGDMKIRSYFTPAQQQINALRTKHDLVIGLTHLGYNADRSLVNNTRGFDLVIGGHSHTVLQSYTTARDRSRKWVPIVQTGANGLFIGRVTMEIDRLKSPRILTYELVPVTEDDPMDEVVAKKVDEANQAVEQLYGKDFLNEVIGHSEVRLVAGNKGATAFSEFITESFQNALKADAALDVGYFHGITPQAEGPITRKKLMEMYARKFEESHNEGLYLYETRVPGLVLWAAAKIAARYGVHLEFKGLKYKTYTLSDEEYQQVERKEAQLPDHQKSTRYRAYDITIGNKPIDKAAGYRVAMPEQFVRGGFETSKWFRRLVKSSRKTNITIWKAMEDYLRKIKVIKKERWDRVSLHDDASFLNVSSDHSQEKDEQLHHMMDKHYNLNLDDFEDLDDVSIPEGRN